MTTDERWLRLRNSILSANAPEFTTLLEAHDVDLNLQNAEGSSLLHEAVRCSSTFYEALRCHPQAIVKMLVEKEQVDVNIRNKRGRTPLWDAASRGCKAVVKIFLENDKVDPEAKDENGQTPLSAAVMGQDIGSISIPATAHESVVELLLASGRVDPDAQDARGLTPLAWAARAGQAFGIAEMLLSTGIVDANSKSELGITPLMWSAASDNHKVKELLLNSGRLDKDLKPDQGTGDVNSRYINHWIDSCDAQHGAQCKPASLERKLPQQLPHWVIDISQACLVPGNTVSRYVALSYVWSQGFLKAMNDKRPPDSILLKKLNLSDFRKPGFLDNIMEKLPTVVKDAIPLVRRLGENYLWVDCLCIVQDDEKTREQVDHMGDIYSGAYFTIIAATLWGQLSSDWGRGRTDETLENLYDVLNRSTWATRGWTFQEQMLSRRAIVFDQTHMFWECQQCVWSPEGPRPETTTTESASFTVPHYEKANRMLSSCSPNFELWIEMISLYNSRNFTYPQDVLPAFSGVLSTLGRSFPSGFQYGLPRVHLDIALLWQPFRKACRRSRRDQDSDTPAPTPHLPSWSWCGWTCPVDPYHLRTRSSSLNLDCRASQVPIWRTEKLVQWYSLPEDMLCQVLADRPWVSAGGARIAYKDGKSTYASRTHTGNDDDATGNIARIVQSAFQETGASPLSSPTPPSACLQYGSQPHDTWPFLSCQTSCLSLYIGAVHYSRPRSLSNFFLLKRSGRPSIYKLPQFTKGPLRQDACDLIRLQNQEGRSAGMLRHMQNAHLRTGDTVDLIAISAGSTNSTGVEGDEEDKLYRLEMEAYVGCDLIHPATSEYLEVKKEMELYGVEGSDGREYHFYNVLWVERKEGIAYRRAAGRVPKAIWDAKCTPLTKIILG